MADYNLEIGIDLNSLNSDLSKATANMEDFSNTSKKAGKEVQDTFDNQKKGSDEAIKSQKKVSEEIKKEISSVSELRNKISSLSKARDESNDIASIKKYNKEIENTQKSLDGLVQKTSTSGKGLGVLFSGISESVKSMINPVTILTGGVLALTAGYLKAGNEIRKLETTTKNLFGDTEDSTQLTIKAREFAAVYDKDVNEGLRTANVLVKEFDISANSAYDLIEQGIRRGADANGDFLEQLREYSSQFAGIGLNAEESIAIITQTVNRGVFSDKGVDLIKEAGIRLREMPQSTKDALKAIGLNSSEIQKEIQNGTKTTFQVIQEVSNKTKEFGIDAQETGLVLADVFGGAGEDAGKFVLELGSVKTDLDDIKDNTSDLENAQQGLTRSWSRFVDNIASGDSLISSFFASALNGISSLVSALDDAFSSYEIKVRSAREQADKETTKEFKNRLELVKQSTRQSTEFLQKQNQDIQKTLNSFSSGVTGTEAKELARQKKINDIIIEGRKKGVSDEITLINLLSDVREVNTKKSIALEKQLSETVKLNSGVLISAKVGEENKKLIEEVSKRSINASESLNEINKQIKTVSNSTLEQLSKTANSEIKIIALKELDKRKQEELNDQEKKRASITSENAKGVDKLRQERERLENEFLAMLNNYSEKSRQATLNGLEGEEKINTILSNSIQDIQSQQAVLLELNEQVGKNVAENKARIIEDTANLILEAETKAKESLQALRDKEDQDNTNNTLGNIDESSQIAQLTKELDLKIEVGETEIEFEKRKANAILEIQKQSAEEKLRFLEASGEDENSLRTLQLKKLISDIEGKLNIGLEESLQKSLADQFNDSLKNIFGINDAELADFKTSVSDLAKTLTENYTSMIQNQIDEKTRLIDTYEQNINDIESQLEREISKNEEGNASNIAGLEAKLAREKELQAQAERDREILMEKERKFRKQIAIAELAQNTALQISNLALAISRASAETGAGALIVVPALIGLLATVIGGISSIASQPDTSGFFKGGYTGGNSKFEERGVVHGKEFVHTADKTARYRTLFDGIHSDNNDLISRGISDLLQGTGISLLEDTPDRIKSNQQAIVKARDKNNSERYLKGIEENTRRQKTEKEERYLNENGNEVVIKGNTKKTYV
jgi:Phage-related minor tail protein